MSLYQVIPVMLLNFGYVTMFTWVTLLTVSISDEDRQLMPIVTTYRKSICFFESLLVSATTTLLPITILKYVAPACLGLSVAIWLYRRNVILQLTQLANDVSTKINLKNIKTVMIHNREIQIKHIQRRYTALSIANDTILSSFFVMAIVVLFSIFST